jgi:hypothetical protein
LTQFSIPHIHRMWLRLTSQQPTSGRTLARRPAGPPFPRELHGVTPA